MTKRNRNMREGQGRRLAAALVLVVAILIAFGAGFAYAYGTLKTLWQEQCVVRDRELDVVITSGKMVHPDAITYHFGLTNGVNLATLPFAELRTKLLEKVPNIRDLKIERRLPNRVTIDVVEREPLARIAPPRGRVETGRVADIDGVVFRFSNNTSLLPVVREAAEPATPPGHHLTGNAAAALRLIEAVGQPDLADLRVLEVDTSHKDFLLVTLGNYDRARVSWDHMTDNSRLSRDSLHKQLRRLSSAVKQHLTPNTTLWIATDWGTPGRVYASDPSRNGNQ